MIKLEVKSWVLQGEEIQKTWRKTLEAQERMNKQLYSHVMAKPGIEPMTRESYMDVVGALAAHTTCALEYILFMYTLSTYQLAKPA